MGAHCAPLRKKKSSAVPLFGAVSSLRFSPCPLRERGRFTRRRKPKVVSFLSLIHIFSGAAELRGIAVKKNRKLRQGSGKFLFAVRKIAQGEQRFSVCTALHAEYAGRIRMIFRPPEIIRRIICVQRGILHISFAQAVEKTVERTLGQCPVQCTGFAPFVQLTRCV